MKKRNSRKASPTPAGTDRSAVQGEGNYEAARRYRDDLEKFVRTADIDRAAREAAPQDAREASEMTAAEAAGRNRSKQPPSKAKPPKGGLR